MNPLRYSLMQQAKCQLGTVMAQGGKQIRFCACKLKETQLKHTMTERESPAVIQTLKKCCNVLLGQLCTDHINLTCEAFIDAERTM
jgi:hypothetical protein